MLLNENQRVAQLCTCFGVLPGCFKCLKQNQRVAQLLFWCAARLFLFFCTCESTCSSTPALVLVCCQAVSSVVK